MFLLILFFLGFLSCSGNYLSYKRSKCLVDRSRTSHCFWRCLAPIWRRPTLWKNSDWINYNLPRPTSHTVHGWNAPSNQVGFARLPQCEQSKDMLLQVLRWYIGKIFKYSVWELERDITYRKWLTSGSNTNKSTQLPLFSGVRLLEVYIPTTLKWATGNLSIKRSMWDHILFLRQLIGQFIPWIISIG